MSDFQRYMMKVVAAALVFLLAIAALGGCIPRPVIVESTWPESAEFSTLGTGQDRFSEHETNLEGWCVLVDHRTGAQYLYRYKYGVSPLLDVDGTPLLVAEAGE